MRRRQRRDPEPDQDAALDVLAPATAPPSAGGATRPARAPMNAVRAVTGQAEGDVEHAQGQRLRPHRPVAGAMTNCGRKARKNNATFGLSRLTTRPSR